MNLNDPHIGDAVSFLPSAFTGETKYLSPESMERMRMAYTLRGVVSYVNAAHRYYTVEAPCWGCVIRESFKF